MNFKYKSEKPLAAERKRHCISIKEKYPDTVPIICEKYPNSQLRDLNRKLLLIDDCLKVTILMNAIRDKITLDKDDYAPFLLVGNQALPSDSTMKDIYEKYKNAEDGFLYIAYNSEVIEAEGFKMLIFNIIADRSEGIVELVNIREKYPDTIPIFCKNPPGSFLMDLDIPFYLSSQDQSINQFSSLLRNHLDMDEDDLPHYF